MDNASAGVFGVDNERFLCKVGNPFCFVLLFVLSLLLYNK